MASPPLRSPRSSKTPPPSLRTLCPTTTADPCRSPGAAPSLHHPAILGSRGGSRTRSALLWMGTTRVSTPIRGMRKVYGPSMRPAGIAVGSRDALLALGDADVGAGDPAGAASPLEPQAAVKATRTSPARNRASPRDAQQAGRNVVGSGVMQESAAGNCCSSGHRTTGQHQTDEPSPGTSGCGV